MQTRHAQIEQVRRRLAEEAGTLFKDAPVRVALCYPSPYHVGMSSLGFQQIYRQINGHPGACAERAFLPDDVEVARESRVPLFTYETQAPVSSFPVLAFSVAYELEVTGLFSVLELSGLPVLRERRGEGHPLVVAGGPLTFSNPEPLEPFVDVIVQGEADDLIHELLERVAEATSREGLLSSLAGRPGFRVPGRSPESSRLYVEKASEKRLPARSQIV
ncbi:MAG: radical SAM protein, partial [Polyangiaceae bacterium]|nr:radical SAM protein [Polyangiaceae bacterium]